jgi:hypothetical protein
MASSPPSLEIVGYSMLAREKGIARYARHSSVSGDLSECPLNDLSE